ncbi:hypothetical protein SJ947_14745, partial [Enterococcus faecium]
LAVLIDTAEHGATAERGATGAAQPPGASVADALGAFARVWLERMPLAGDTSSPDRMRLRSSAALFDDEPIRNAFGQMTHLEALLLALALESLAPDGAPSGRQVRRAQLVMRLLDGAGPSADPALGLGDPFDIVQACAHLGGLALADTWNPPHLPYVPPAGACHAQAGRLAAHLR